jgi:glycosyltransferase involved in cell wall biosynthesis
VSPSEITSAVLWAGRTFCQEIVARGIGKAASVYTFNNAGLELMQHAHRHGRFTILEQTLAPKIIEREWLQRERKTFPHWEPPPAEDHLLATFSEREASEWREADLILCGSEFVRTAIGRCGGPVERCKVVPYGVDSFGWMHPRPPRHAALRVLTVGSVGLRKGAPYVLAAAQQLRQRATFRMAGPIEILPEAEEQLRRTVELVGPVPREEIAKHFQWADVFLLPSLCEGSATVAYEALASGLPVVTTENSGTVVRDGVDGFIVPPRDVESIVEVLSILAADRTFLREMSRKARGRSIEFDWTAYARNLLAVLPAGAPPLAPNEGPQGAPSR